MIRALLLSSILALSACGEWDQLTTTEKVVWSVVGAGLVGLATCNDRIGGADCF